MRGTRYERYVLVLRFTGLAEAQYLTHEGTSRHIELARLFDSKAAIYKAFPTPSTLFDAKSVHARRVTITEWEDETL